MEKNSVWYLAGICLIGVVIGIIFVGVHTSVVHWRSLPYGFRRDGWLL